MVLPCAKNDFGLIETIGQHKHCRRTASYDEDAWLSAVLASNGNAVPASAGWKDHDEASELFCPSNHYRKMAFVLDQLCDDHTCPEGALCECQPCEDTPPVVVSGTFSHKRTTWSCAASGGWRRAQAYRHRHRHRHTHFLSFFLCALQIYPNEIHLSEEVLQHQHHVVREQVMHTCSRSNTCTTSTQLLTQHFLIEDKLHDLRHNKDTVFFHVVVLTPLGEQFAVDSWPDAHHPDLATLNITTLHFGIYSIEVCAEVVCARVESSQRKK